MGDQNLLSPIGYLASHSPIGLRGILLASHIKATKCFHMILSVDKSFHALVSHLCLIGLREVGMPYSDMWQDCQTTFPHNRHYAKPSRAFGKLDFPDPTSKRPSGRSRAKYGPTNSAAITRRNPKVIWEEPHRHPSRQRI